MCGKEHSVIEKLTMALADELEGVEFYTAMLYEMPEGDPAIPTVQKILDDERMHAKFFYTELGKHL